MSFPGWWTPNGLFRRITSYNVCYTKLLRDYVEVPLAAEAPGDYRSDRERKEEIERLRKSMLQAAADLEFEKAAEFRDRLLALERQDIGLK